MKRPSHFAAHLVLFACTALASCAQTPASSPTGGDAEERTYGVVYSVRIEDTDTVQASIRVEQPSRWLRELRFSIDPERYRDFEGDGEITESDGEVTWLPPRRGGTLSYTVRVSNQRSSGAYDARLTDRWGLFRGGDIFPPAAARTVVGALSVASLEFDLPEGWSALTPYLSGDSDMSFPIENAVRRFDRVSEVLA